MSKRDTEDLLQYTIKKDGEYQKQLIECIELKNKEIERLTAESTEWESKFYDEAKKVDKAIDLLEGARENIDLPIYDRQHLIEKTINELKGDENE